MGRKTSENNESGKMILDLILQLTKQLVDRGVDQDEAAAISLGVARFMGHYWGGTMVYFSAKQLAMKLMEMELEKNLDIPRSSIVKLVRKHKLNERIVYDTLRKLREQAKQAREA